MISFSQERALNLLGSGAGPEIVASALGVTTSAISQLLSDEEFAKKVIELRYKSLSKHVDRDNKADNLEDKILTKLENVIDYIMDPMKLLAAYRVVNQAKRRSSTVPEQIAAAQPVHSITMPTMIVQQFTTNIHNQIVKSGEQDLVTIPSNRMDHLLSESREKYGHVKNEPELIERIQ